MDKKDLHLRSSYHYDLPDELIAQYPLAERSQSKLLVIHRNDEHLEHRQFFEISNYFKAGDVLILNSSKVIPARLIGFKETGAKVEVFMLNPVTDHQWVCLVKPGRKLRVGSIIHFSERLKAKIIDYAEEGARLIEFYPEGDLMQEIRQVGKIPLPPYIQRECNQEDIDTYQTIYAKEDGSVAAPTAGLHFTQDLLAELRAKGVLIHEVVLHVGLGTFRPVQAENITDHNMHSEYCTISESTAQAVNLAKSENRRVIAVGTTSVRTLESFYHHGQLESGSKWTNIFIYPGKKVQVVDALITNFHMPESSLLMLISAFAGYDLIMNAYRTAINEKYRFFSYGDACLIL